MTVDDFVTGIGSAAWNMNLTRFCEVLGWTEDNYAEDKFVEFQDLARLLGRFDDTTLAKILQAQGVAI